MIVAKNIKKLGTVNAMIIMYKRGISGSIVIALHTIAALRIPGKNGKELISPATSLKSHKNSCQKAYKMNKAQVE